MSYGFLVNGSSGQVQIENTRNTFVVKSAGVLSVPYNIASVRALANTGNGEFLVIRPVAGFGTITWNSYNNALQHTCSSGSVEYLVIARTNMVGISSDAFGLRVFDGASGLIFDSGLNPPKPIGQTVITRSGSANVNDWYTSSTLTFPVSGLNRKRYVGFSFLSFIHTWSTMQSGGSESIYTAVVFNSNDSITFRSAYISSRPAIPPASTVAPQYGYVFEY